MVIEATTVSGNSLRTQQHHRALERSPNPQLGGKNGHRTPKRPGETPLRPTRRPQKGQAKTARHRCRPRTLSESVPPNVKLNRKHSHTAAASEASRSHPPCIHIIRNVASRIAGQCTGAGSSLRRCCTVRVRVWEPKCTHDHACNSMGTQVITRGTVVGDTLARSHAKHRGGCGG